MHPLLSFPLLLQNNLKVSDSDCNYNLKAQIKDKLASYCFPFTSVSHGRRVWGLLLKNTESENLIQQKQKNYYIS